MSAQEIYEWWFIWLVIGACVVVAAAVLLITIIALAHRIAVLGNAALEIVEEIQSETLPIWQLGDTNQVARDLLGGAEAIRDNAGAITSALMHSATSPARDPV
jgi:hypothetical protein